MRYCFLVLAVLLSSFSFSQKLPAYVSGLVVDENDKPLPEVSVTILGRQKGLTTSDSGTFRIKLPTDRHVALVFTVSGYRDQQKDFLLNAGEEEKVTIIMVRTDKV